MTTTLLLDCDGILADFVSAYLDIVRGVTGRSYSPHHVTQFSIETSLALSSDEAMVCNRAIGLAPGFARGIPVYEGAQDGLRRLQQIADVYVVTAPWNANPSWTHDREWWLKKHFDIPHSRVIHTSAKHLVRGDVFVDDKTSTCEAWREAHPDGLAVQWITPHNRRDAWDGIETSSWDYLVDLVRARPVERGLVELAANAPARVDVGGRFDMSEEG